MVTSPHIPNGTPSPVELLQHLIRFDTTNPPGNEAACIRYVDEMLTQAGLETTVLAKDANRPNLIAHLKGQGAAPALLLYGHVDVVTTADQVWTHPPFSGEVSGGYVWGRGALDMKGGVVMMLSALLRLKAEGIQPAGDIVFVLVSDEEVGGEYGAQYLVENHAEQFKDVRYAIGEFGGFPMYVGQKKFYAIQVAEKRVCWLKATIRGRGGHGSMPLHGGAMAKLGRLLETLDTSRLPVHLTPIVRQMLEAMAAATGLPTSMALTQLFDPRQTDRVLDGMGPQGLLFDAMLHNTLNATMVTCGHKVNVIPSEITVNFDGRLLPGFTPTDLIAELKGLVGNEVELEVIQSVPGPSEPDMGMFKFLADILREADPEGTPVPLLLTGSTDARHFSRLNIQTYGFLPMNLDEHFNFVQSIHAADERIPVEALEFGAQAIHLALRRYGVVK